MKRVPVPIRILWVALAAHVIWLRTSDANGDVGITAALQHPYSHGRIYINSSNPLDYPVIDPNYLAHPAGMFLQPPKKFPF